MTDDKLRAALVERILDAVRYVDDEDIRRDRIVAALAASATDEPTHDHPDPERMGRVGCLACELRLAASTTDEGPWKEDARRYAQNADYWRDLYETAAATIERLSARPAVPALDVSRWIDSLHEDVNGTVWTTKNELRAALAASATDEWPDLLRASDRTMAEYSDDRSACPRCGEWRDNPTADCSACGYDFARPAVPALDVSRLAEAINAHIPYSDTTLLRVDAEAIAREYAALRSKEPTDG